MLAMYSGTATLEAEADAEIIAKVGGEVRRILVEEGDRVKAGQVLAILDDRQLRLQAAQTRAALAKAERDFNRQVELHEKGLVSAGAFEDLKYDLDNQRAANDIASLSLSYSEIRAPFAGIVSERHVKLGQEIADRHQHVSRHGSHAAQGRGVRARARARAPQARAGRVDCGRRPRRPRLSRRS